MRPAFRGRGIGKALMQRLARSCVDSGYARFEWAVLDWNAPSIAFYQSIGAEMKGEWKICRLSGPALAKFAGQGLMQPHAYQPEQWRDLYVMLGTSAAALIGLLFVATSLHLERAWCAIPPTRRAPIIRRVYLVLLLVEAVFVLVPQPPAAFGAEVVFAQRPRAFSCR